MRCLFWTLEAPTMHVVHIYACRQNTHAQKRKCMYKVLDSFIFVVIVCARCVNAGWVPWCAREGQRTTSISTWVSGTQQRSPGLRGKCVYPLGCLTRFNHSNLIICMPRLVYPFWVRNKRTPQFLWSFGAIIWWCWTQKKLLLTLALPPLSLCLHHLF